VYDLRNYQGLVKKMQFGVVQRGAFEWNDNIIVRFDNLMKQARSLEVLGYARLPPAAISPPSRPAHSSGDRDCHTL
jgi:hypothetical protein